MKFLIAILAGTAIHAGLSLLERLIPGLGPGLDPFLRLLPALVASLLVTASRRPPTLFGITSVGAVAAGLTGVLGMLVASAIWLPSGHALPAITSVSGTSLLIGAFGGLLGYQRARLRAPESLGEHPAGSYPEAPQTR